MGTTAMENEQEQEQEQLVKGVTADVQQYADAAVDATTDTRRIRMVPVAGDNLPETERVRLVADTPDGPMGLAIMDGAHGQLADKLDIPKRHYERLRKDHPDLLAGMVTELMHREPAKRMVRMLRPVTEADRQRLAVTGSVMSVRAWLGEGYRPLDHSSLLNTVLPELQQAGARITNWTLTAERFTLRATMSARDVLDFATPEQRDYWRTQVLPDATQGLKAGERIAFGVQVRNSETGHAMMTVSPWAQVLRCLNGLLVIEEDALKVRHIGGSKTDDSGWTSSDTKRLESAATFLKVRDRVRFLLSEDAQATVGRAVLTGAQARLALPEGADLFTFVDGVGQRFSLTDRETEVLKQELAHEVAVTGGQLTRWSVSQAFTATARQAETERRLELEGSGWKVLTDPLAGLLARN